MIKNLSQLKQVLQIGVEFEIIKHRRPDFIGQRRQITVANSQCFYSIIPSEPKSRISMANAGKGMRFDWGKASFWQFENGICALYDNDNQRTEESMILAFRVLQKEAA